MKINVPHLQEVSTDILRMAETTCRLPLALFCFYQALFSAILSSTSAGIARVVD